MPTKHVWNLSRRTALSITTLAIVSIAVSGLVLSNYLLPSRVRITSQPGLTVFLADLSTGQCTATVATFLDFGDVQQTQLKEAFSICIKNSGGSAVAYLIDAFTPQGQHISSLDSSPNPVATGVTLTWNFPSIYNSNTCAGSSLNGPCVGLQPGQGTSPLRLRLAADTTAQPATIDFTIIIQSFDTVNG